MEFITTFGLALLTATTSVSFDVPALAPAHSAAHGHLSPQLPNSRFVDVALDISTIVSPEFRGSLNETLIEVRAQHEDVQVADFTPRTSMYSNVSGDVRVTQSYNVDREASLNAKGFYPVFASADGHASYRDNEARTVAMEQIAPMHMLTSAGTLDRRTGVYFKMRRGPQSVLEGAKRFHITLEVPYSWRGDLLEVRVSAFGATSDPRFGKSDQQLSAARYFVAIYQNEDAVASQTAMHFAKQHIRLQTEAANHAKEISRRAVPTPVHMLGKALDLYEPSIPSNWLEEWVFGTKYQKPAAGMPVNLKIVMLDFQDARSNILQLAHDAPVTASYSKYASQSNRRVN